MAADPHRDQPVREYGRPLEAAAGVVILVHGRGAPAADILGLGRELHHPDLAYLAPEAAGHTWYPQSLRTKRTVVDLRAQCPGKGG